MRHKLPPVIWFLISTPLIHAQGQPAPARNALCNQDGTLCVKAAMRQSVVRNPFYFEVYVRCPEQIILTWELRDDSGRVLDADRLGSFAFVVNKSSASERTLAVRDFALAPARARRGRLLLHATTDSIRGDNHPLPELSVPLRLDARTTPVSYAVPGIGFSGAVIESVESDPAHRVPMQADVDWQTTALLYVQPAMLGGTAAEAAVRAYPSQGLWHVINYSKGQGTAHLTIHGDGWAGVTYYLTGLHFLLEKTLAHQPGVQRVVFDRPPDFAQ